MAGLWHWFTHINPHVSVDLWPDGLSLSLQAPKFSAKRACLREELMQAALSDEEVGEPAKLHTAFSMSCPPCFPEVFQPRFSMEANT